MLLISWLAVAWRRSLYEENNNTDSILETGTDNNMFINFLNWAEKQDIEASFISGLRLPRVSWERCACLTGNRVRESEREGINDFHFPWIIHNWQNKVIFKSGITVTLR